MAALNTLRTKGGVVLAVVIGISLLAFLLGDLTSSSGTLFNSSNMNVGVIDGEKVSVQEYSGEIDKLTLVQQMLTGRESLNEQETEAVRSQTWDKIIRAKAFSESLTNLGLTVSEEEQVDMANGEYISPILMSIFVDQQTGGYDREMVKNFVSNIEADQSGRSATFWAYIENEMLNERALAKYFALIKNGIYVTNVEAEDITKISNNNFNIEFVTKPTYSVADSLVTVKEADLKAYYDAHKSQFKQVASRDIEYVVFESLPSPKDYEDAKTKVSEIANEFRTTEDIKQFVNLNSNNGFDPSYKKAAEMAPEMAAYAFGAKADSIYGPVLNGDIYTMARIVESKDLPDTLGAKHILIAADNAALADSLLTVLKADKTKFAEIASQYSQDKNANLSGGDLGSFAMSQMIPEFSSAVAAAKVGEIIKVKTPYGLHIVEVTKIGELFPKVQMAVINYTVDPSTETSQTTFAKATDFASKASAKNADFDKVASEVGTTKRV
ncbi:MAG: peptidylprolyl isomerase, partial [Rikenellaceae bacterium]